MFFYFDQDMEQSINAGLFNYNACTGCPSLTLEISHVFLRNITKP